MEMDFHRWGVEEFVTTGSLMEPPGACSPQPSFWVLMNNQKLLMWCVIVLLAQCPGKVGLFSVHTPGAVKGGVRTALWLRVGLLHWGGREADVVKYSLCCSE